LKNETGQNNCFHHEHPKFAKRPEDLVAENPVGPVGLW